jgi:hypothetical protein
MFPSHLLIYALNASPFTVLHYKLIQNIIIRLTKAI